MKLPFLYNRRFAGLAAVWVVCLLASCFALSSLVRSASNSLYKNGNWIVTKTLVARRPMLAYEFLLTRRALRRNMLNLCAWSACNEVLFRDRLVLKRFRADVFWPDADAEFYCVFSKNEKGFNAVKLVAGQDKDVVLLRADTRGGFVSRTSLGRASISNGWHKMEVGVEGSVLSVSIDGREIGRTRNFINESGFTGVRGMQAKVCVDNVVIDSPERTLVREDFSNHGSGWRFFLYIVFCFVAVNTAIVLFLRFVLKRDMNSIIFSGLGLNVLVLLLILIFCAADYFFLSDRVFLSGQRGSYTKRYLNRFERAARNDHKLRGILDREMDYLFDYQKDCVRGRLDKRYRDTKDKNTVRILFLGSSQTWGEGTDSEEETFVHLLEKRLNSSGPVAGKKFECINGAVAGFTAERALEFYKNNMAWLKPDICIVNFGNNLSSSDFVYKDALLEIGRINKGTGIETVLVQEACIPVDGRPNPYYRPLTQQAAQSLKVGLWDLHSYMKDCEDKGFIWWDSMHMSACGHEFASEFFAEKIKPLLNEKFSAQSENI